MPQEDRRQFRRTRLRLQIARLEGLNQASQAQDLWTANMSAGGMFFRLPPGEPPATGTDLAFEITVPPGEGYSSSAGKVRGTGKVVRTQAMPDAGTGVAVQFTRPLALDF
jgi:galactokinase